MSHKLHALTLLELMVAMVVTGILVVAVFGGLNFLSQQQTMFNSDREARQERQRLYSSLFVDCSRATRVNVADQSLIIQCEEESVTYEFDSASVRRFEEVELRFATNIQSVEIDSTLHRSLVTVQFSPGQGIPDWVFPISSTFQLHSPWQ